MSKKIILITTLLSGLASFSCQNIAIANSADPDSNLYFKTLIGITSFKPISAGGGPFDFFRTSFSGKDSSAPNLGFGFGYQIKDNTRVDITLDHVTNVRLKDPTSARKAQSVFNVIMLNGYLDLVKFGETRIFVGGGGGIAHISERISLASNSTGTEKETSHRFKSNKLAFMLALGCAMPIYEGVKMDAAYSWKEFGKSKSHKQNGKEIAEVSYKGHNFSLSLRFDI